MTFFTLRSARSVGDRNVWERDYRSPFYVQMVRRIASQVHKQASRLTRAGFLKTPPVWYEAVLDHPPLPLPPREPPARTPYDSATQKQAFAPKKTPGPRVMPVKYIEDDIRRQFFRDHPFEAFRARSITEAGAVEDEHPINGIATHLLTSSFP